VIYVTVLCDCLAAVVHITELTLSLDRAFAIGLFLLLPLLLELRKHGFTFDSIVNSGKLNSI